MTQPQPFRLSASKLKRWLTCPRAYFLRYVQGVEEDVRGNYLVVGTAYDLHVQWYLSRGAQGVQSIDPRILRMFEAARRYLPEPGLVEVQFRYSVPHPDGFVVEGTPDLRRPGWLGDTKTTGAPGPGEGSAMTERQLCDDVQFRLYAWCEFQLDPGLTKVNGVWSYVNKDTKPKAWNVRGEAFVLANAIWFDSVVRPAAAAMAKLHAEYDADRVVANLDSCERCWVRAHCSPFDGPNSYDGVAGLISPASLKRTRPTLSANKGVQSGSSVHSGLDSGVRDGGYVSRTEGALNMPFDLKQLSEDVDLTEALTASVRKAAETKQMVETVGETIQINPPPALRARPARKETPAESKLENLASELQTVVDTCQGAIARLDRMLAEIRGGQ
ncbi:MAG TPA: PD-(D/E)XK nuclease family protein [Polyangiaceae bacterium]